MQQPDKLFVYGTLMARANDKVGIAERKRLKEQTDFIGYGSIEGQLYDLGSYPGLVLGDGESEGEVFGEVYGLRDVETTLAWLDEYEGVGSWAEADREYARVITCVTGLGMSRILGPRLVAWVYVYARPVDDLACVPGGRWLCRGARVD